MCIYIISCMYTHDSIGEAFKGSFTMSISHSFTLDHSFQAQFSPETDASKNQARGPGSCQLVVFLIPKIYSEMVRRNSFEWV